MIESLGVIEASGTNPYENLALERLLFENIIPGRCVLYLWQNAHTVVIGRNQNALDECDVPALEADGGHLVRRLSGGGAVYHDLGNLNFTFLIPTEDFSVATQNEVVLQAVRALGIPALATGRNDLTVDGQKFSGAAYLHEAEKSYHHGTLMLNADFSALSRYLRPSPLKLKARGVKSVRARVVNLASLVPTLTIDELKAALTQSFGEVYGAPVQHMAAKDLDAQRWHELSEKFASPAWNLGRRQHLSQGKEARFDWGTVRLDVDIASANSADAGSESANSTDTNPASAKAYIKQAYIKQAYLWTDALSEGLPTLVERALIGTALDLTQLQERLEKEGVEAAVAADLAQLVVSIASH